MPFACGNLYITINVLDGKPFRVFLKLGKAGVCQRALLESVARLTTILLQDSTVPLDRIRKTLVGIACDNGMIGRPSCVHVLSEELRKFVPVETDNE